MQINIHIKDWDKAMDAVYAPSRMSFDDGMPSDEVMEGAERVGEMKMMDAMHPKRSDSIDPIFKLADGRYCCPNQLTGCTDYFTNRQFEEFIGRVAIEAAQNENLSIQFGTVEEFEQGVSDGMQAHADAIKARKES